MMSLRYADNYNKYNTDLIERLRHKTYLAFLHRTTIVFKKSISADVLQNVSD